MEYKWLISGKNEFEKNIKLFDIEKKAQTYTYLLHILTKIDKKKWEIQP